MPAVRFSVGTRRVLRILTVAFAAILVGSFAMHVARRVYGHDFVFGLAPLLNVDGEANLPAWLSSTSFFFAAILAYALSQKHQKNAAQDDRAEAFAWSWTALVLLLLSADEGAQLHEFAYRLMGRLGSSWYLVMGVALVGAGIFYLLMFRRIPNPVRRRIVGAGALFAAGALGMEVVTSVYLRSGGSKISLAYSGLCHIEETLEIAGILLLLRALLSHLERETSETNTVLSVSPELRR